MNTPKVSILVPVYNVEKYIEECIESLINQTYENLEIILVDDGSTDNSGIICDKYAEKDSRIKVIHQENQGLATVRNVSVAAATGDYIGFVDSDDFIAHDMYEGLISVAEEKNADIVMCNLGYVDQNGNEIPNYRSAQPISDRELTGRQFVEELCNKYNSTYVVPGTNFTVAIFLKKSATPMAKSMKTKLSFTESHINAIKLYLHQKRTIFTDSSRQA